MGRHPFPPVIVSDLIQTLAYRTHPSKADNRILLVNDTGPSHLVPPDDHTTLGDPGRMNRIASFLPPPISTGDSCDHRSAPAGSHLHSVFVSSFQPVDCPFPNLGTIISQVYLGPQHRFPHSPRLRSPQIYSNKFAYTPWSVHARFLCLSHIDGQSDNVTIL